MSIVAVIPVANLAAANASLQAHGFGPRNFSVASFTGAIATHAALHAWNDAAFSTAGKALPWVRPLDAHNAYRLLDPFTGEPETCTHIGKEWFVSQGDGSGNNIWEPGTFGWTEKGQTPAIQPEPQPGPQAWAIGQSVVVGDLRSHNGKVWKAKVAHVTHAGWEPSAAAWAVWEEQA